jgi:hypothetical protein
MVRLGSECPSNFEDAQVNWLKHAPLGYYRLSKPGSRGRKGFRYNVVWVPVTSPYKSLLGSAPFICLIVKITSLMVSKKL